MSKTPDGQPERKFVIELTETTKQALTLTEAEAREYFPDIPWGDPDASQAGHIEDAIQGGLEDDLHQCFDRIDPVQEDVTLKAWEV